MPKCLKFAYFATSDDAAHIYPVLTHDWKLPPKVDIDENF
jgi:hypothetical protein